MRVYFSLEKGKWFYILLIRIQTENIYFADAVICSANSPTKTEPIYTKLILFEYPFVVQRIGVRSF